MTSESARGQLSVAIHWAVGHSNGKGRSRKGRRERQDIEETKRRVGAVRSGRLFVGVKETRGLRKTDTPKEIRLTQG